MTNLHTPWEPNAVDVASWEGLGRDLARGKYVLTSLWGGRGHVSMALLDPVSGKSSVAHLPVPDGTFPSIAKHYLPALRLERSITDMCGFTPVGCPDPRPWQDHGVWGVKAPLTDNKPHTDPPPPYTFLPVEGEGLHQIPVGPIHAGIIEPGHFRFTANGETVVRLEERLGYMHRGAEKLFEGQDISGGAKIAARLSGDSTVAYSLAYARAVEAAWSLDVPQRAHFLRALFAEIERIANHLGDIGAICNDAAFSVMLAHCGILREETLRLAFECFGHRLMMDRIVPGGVKVDLTRDSAEKILAWAQKTEKHFEILVDLYDNTASLRDRTDTTGTVSAELVTLYGAGGHVGRASGRQFDSRKNTPYPPYDRLDFEIPLRNTGDVNARVWIRICEIRQSLSLIRQILNHIPEGGIAFSLPESPPAETQEGAALVEAFRGDVFIWLRITDGKIERCHPRDPSWFQWPLLENAIKGNIVADFPLCNKSFNCSYAGQDL